MTESVDARISRLLDLLESPHLSEKRRAGVERQLELLGAIKEPSTA